MAKKIDPQAKAKRQKITAAALGVLLLGVLAFQLPRTLKMLHQSSASASPAATTTAAAATGTTGAAGALAAAGSTSGSGSTGDGLTDPGVLPAPQSGQLLGFSRFRSKDPFTQQINLACASETGSTGGCGTGTPPSGGGKPTKPTPPRTSSPPSNGGAAVKPTSAEISVNGTTESVAVGAKFPASNPTFVLVSLTKSSAKISIAGGSLEGDKQTVTLKKGVALTLMNTADGTRYVLRLVSVG
jgi:hypothetical protein